MPFLKDTITADELREYHEYLLLSSHEEDGAFPDADYCSCDVCQEIAPRIWAAMEWIEVLESRLEKEHGENDKSQERPYPNERRIITTLQARLNEARICYPVDLTGEWGTNEACRHGFVLALNFALGVVAADEPEGEPVKPNKFYLVQLDEDGDWETASPESVKQNKLYLVQADDKDGDWEVEVLDDG